VVTRTYRSPRRALQAQQTRAAVLAACRALFGERGWAATGVRDVAAAAEVSVETVYATLGGKVALLTAALDGAVAGDDEPIPLSERPAFLAMGEGGFDERVTAAAALITDIHLRTIGLQRALREGAGGEPALAELLTTQEENRRTSTGLGMTLVLGRPVDDRERDLFWAQTSPEVYDALVNRSGWSTEDYAAWVASLIENLKGEL
jgi:AcrR family transcriptional regulator